MDQPVPEGADLLGFLEQVIRVQADQFAYRLADLAPPKQLRKGAVMMSRRSTASFIVGAALYSSNEPMPTK